MRPIAWAIEANINRVPVRAITSFHTDLAEAERMKRRHQAEYAGCHREIINLYSEAQLNEARQDAYDLSAMCADNCDTGVEAFHKIRQLAADELVEAKIAESHAQVKGEFQG